MTLKFKSGDVVRFLNDTGGGVVSHISPEGLVFVMTQDGFEIPVPAKDLVHATGFDVPDLPEPETMKAVTKPAPVKKTERETIPAGSKQTATLDLPRNIVPDIRAKILIGIIPEQPGPVFSSELAIYLINDSPYFAYYSVGSRERGSLYHLASGLIETDTKNFISVMNQTDINKITGLHVQMIWLSGGRYQRKAPVDELIDTQSVNFSKESYYRVNAYFDEKAILFAVTGADEQLYAESIEVPDEITVLKNDFRPAHSPAGKPEKKSDTLEVDLHMDETDLRNSSLPLTGILALQISRFHAAIEEAVSKKLRKLVIIHGVGQGTLKMQIRKELQEKYPGYVFQDASFREYGFGATMVHLITDNKQ